MVGFFICAGCVDEGTIKLAKKSKMLRINWYFPIQQTHETCCHVSNDFLLSTL